MFFSFYEKKKTTIKVKGRVLQISSIYDKKMRCQTAEFDAVCWKFQNVFQKMENIVRF